MVGCARVDVSRYPRTLEFAENLPEYLESYPDCLVVSEGYDGAKEFLNARDDIGEIPAQVRKWLDGGFGRAWFPEVIGLFGDMMVADLLGDEVYFRWAYEDSMRMFTGPLIRHLIRVMSPTLVVMGARRSWAATRKGTLLVTAPTQRGAHTVTCVATLTFPPGLYSTFFLRVLTLSFKAGISCARARDPVCELTSSSAGEAQFLISWAR